MPEIRAIIKVIPSTDANKQGQSDLCRGITDLNLSDLSGNAEPEAEFLLGRENNHPLRYPKILSSAARKDHLRPGWRRNGVPQTDYTFQ
jgi:hypothetical protein